MTAATAPSRPAGARSVDELLADARSRLVRLLPAQAARRITHGAVLVDIRPAAQAEKPPATSVARCRPSDRSASAARLDV